MTFFKNFEKMHFNFLQATGVIPIGSRGDMNVRGRRRIMMPQVKIVALRESKDSFSSIWILFYRLTIDSVVIGYRDYDTTNFKNTSLICDFPSRYVNWSVFRLYVVICVYSCVYV